MLLTIISLLVIFTELPGGAGHVAMRAAKYATKQVWEGSHSSERHKEHGGSLSFRDFCDWFASAEGHIFLPWLSSLLGED